MTDPCPLYLISPSEIDLPAFCDALRAALDAADRDGVQIACLQLRLKDAADADVLAAAAAIRPLLAAHHVALIINDRADLAQQAGAQGVHLGQGDGSVAAARALLGADADIGVTCHDSRHLAMIAAEEGADYVAFGAFFPTATKSTPYQPEVEILAAWSQMTVMPCVAIGGITAENVAPLVAAGADYVAVSSAVWSHPEGPAAGVAAFAPVLAGTLPASITRP